MYNILFLFDDIDMHKHEKLKDFNIQMLHLSIRVTQVITHMYNTHWFEESPGLLRLQTYPNQVQDFPVQTDTILTGQ